MEDGDYRRNSISPQVTTRDGNSNTAESLQIGPHMARVTSESSEGRREKVREKESERDFFSILCSSVAVSTRRRRITGQPKLAGAGRGRRVAEG